MTQKMTLQMYVNWALNYPVPPLEPPAAYAYYYPFSQDQIPQRFQYAPSPFLIDHLYTCKLVPVTSAARVQLALDYHHLTDGGKAIVWNRSDETGELIDWYESIGMWGATAFKARTGKMGTVLARTRGQLLARALEQGGAPRPNVLKCVRHLPGMDEIVPVLLERGEDSVPGTALVQRCNLQVASDRKPFFRQEHLPSEWLVTLLYEERWMVTYHASEAMPTALQVLQKLFSRMRCFEACAGPDEWMQGGEANELPYAVCEKEMRNLKVLLGTTYRDFSLAFGDGYANGALCVEASSASSSNPHDAPS